jgi:hypothetical protein
MQFNSSNEHATPCLKLSAAAAASPQPPPLQPLFPPHYSTLSIWKQRFAGGTEKTRHLHEGITHPGVYCMASVVSFGFFSAVFGMRLFS